MEEGGEGRPVDTGQGSVGPEPKLYDSSTWRVTSQQKVHKQGDEFSLQDLSSRILRVKS